MASNTLLYPSVEPYKTAYVRVSEVHNLYYEEVGNPDGQCALFLHGGPGLGLMPDYRRFFDPKHYRIILLDQRGAGKSKPYASTVENTTWHLVEDLEILRNLLSIKNWVIMGGSWGSLLALCYAIKYASNVSGLILRGVFLGRKTDKDWLYGGFGTSRLFPEAWERFKKFANAEDNAKLIAVYRGLLNCGHVEVEQSAAMEWNRWSEAALAVNVSQNYNECDNIATARIECHYSINDFFLPSENYILENTGAIADIPSAIVHGRFDTICTVDGAWLLHQNLSHSVCNIISNGAHSPFEADMTAALVDASDAMRSI